MKILTLETSCDETAAAILEQKDDGSIHILSNVLATSLLLHAKTGGIIPEEAAREQIKYMLPVIQQTLAEASLQPTGYNLPPPVDAIAITYGPGLIGSLLVGVETAKTLSYVWNIPIAPVNHLLGHIAANWVVGDSTLHMENKKPRATSYELPAFPLVALIVSGGHTDLLFMKSFDQYQWLGGTRDDAAGEAFDKIGRMLGFAYPAGPMIEQLAKDGNPKAYNFPRPMIGSDDFDFSFSGLKTAAFRVIQEQKSMNEQTKRDLCASVQQAIIDVLIKKTLKAAEKYDAKSILLGGGVCANQTFITQLKQRATTYQLQPTIFAPPKFLCTDNAAMIGAAALLNYKPIPWQKMTANPELYFD